MPDSAIPQDWAGYATALIMFCAAVFERVRGIKKQNEIQVASSKATEAEKSQNATQAILDQKDALLEAANSIAQDWKARYEVERQEYIAYRQSAHEQLDKAQAAILRHTEEIAQLRTRQDMTPILEVLAHQKDATTKILASLDLIVRRLEHIEAKSN